MIEEHMDEAKFEQANQELHRIRDWIEAHTAELDSQLLKVRGVQALLLSSLAQDNPTLIMVMPTLAQIISVGFTLGYAVAKEPSLLANDNIPPAFKKAFGEG